MNASSTENTTIEEEVRPEYKQYVAEFEELMKHLQPMIKDYYELTGRPKTTSISNFAMPNEIIKELGELDPKGASIEECIKTIDTTMKYSLKTMHPFFLDKLYPGSDPIG